MSSSPEVTDRTSPAEPDVSRRHLIAGALVSGAAVAAVPVLTGALPHGGDGAPTYRGPLEEPVVARVRDPRTGVVDIFLGERHVVVHDPELAARLAGAVR
jgi:hypothetical protein